MIHVHSITLCTKDRELFDKGQQYICNFVSKNVSWEVQKAVAIQIMTSAMTEPGKGIVDAAQFATATTGFSQEVVHRWAFSYFTEYPGSLDDLDLDFIATQLYIIRVWESLWQCRCYPSQ